jgi:predicted dehydrogenase
MDSDAGQARLTVGIVGAGQIGRRHGVSFASLGSDVQVVGIADIDQDTAEDLALLCGARSFTDYYALLELQPDIVVISLPHHLHREAGLAAAEAGCHILMEKPLAHTLEDASAIVDGCRRRGVRLAVGFVHRYRLEFQRAAELIRTGQIGKPATAVDIFGLSGGPNVPAWVWEKRCGGGILMYSGIHSVDWQCWLLESEVREVSARSLTYGGHIDVENGLSATLVFANGCVGSLIGNQPGYAVQPRTRLTEIYGSRACLRINSGEYLEYVSDAEGYRLDVRQDDPFVAQAKELVAAVREQRDPWITGKDGLRAQQIVQAIHRSSALGRPVDVNDSGV